MDNNQSNHEYCIPSKDTRHRMVHQNISEYSSNHAKLMPPQIVGKSPNCKQYHIRAHPSDTTLTDQRNPIKSTPMSPVAKLASDDLSYHHPLTHNINDEECQLLISLSINSEDLDSTCKKLL